MGTGTSIGRVRGLGAAKHGSLHWWHQRLTAGSNLLLVTWLVVSLFRLPLWDYRALVIWLSSPWASVIEDYQHDFSRVIALVLLNFYAIGGAALAIFAVLKIAFQGAAA